ncbi:MAG: biopolymer transporter ExbD [Phycisphaerales bacterium]
MPTDPSTESSTPDQSSVIDEQMIEHTSVRKRRGRERSPITLNPVAMIDVVFLLLIYFMTVTDFKLGEEIYRLDLPQRQPSAQVLDPFELDEEPLRITVRSSQIRDDGYSIELSGPYRQPATFEDLFHFLDERRISVHAPGGLFAPDHPIIVEPMRTTRWEHAMEAFNTAARARYTNLTFAKPR